MSLALDRLVRPCVDRLCGHCAWSPSLLEACVLGESIHPENGGVYGLGWCFWAVRGVSRGCGGVWPGGHVGPLLGVLVSSSVPRCFHSLRVLGPLRARLVWLFSLKPGQLPAESARMKPDGLAKVGSSSTMTEARRSCLSHGTRRSRRALRQAGKVDRGGSHEEHLAHLARAFGEGLWGLVLCLDPLGGLWEPCSSDRLMGARDGRVRLVGPAPVRRCAPAGRALSTSYAYERGGDGGVDRCCWGPGCVTIWDRLVGPAPLRRCTPGGRKPRDALATRRWGPSHAWWAQHH